MNEGRSEEGRVAVVEGSRRSRMDELTTDQLFWLGRELVLRKSGGDVSRALLTRAGQQGHEEAHWLASKHNAGNNCVYFDEDSPLDLVYLGFYCHSPSAGDGGGAFAEEHVRRIAKFANETGHGLALYVWSRLTETTKDRQVLLDRAVRAGEPYAHRQKGNDQNKHYAILGIHDPLLSPYRFASERFVYCGEFDGTFLGRFPRLAEDPAVVAMFTRSALLKGYAPGSLLNDTWLNMVRDDVMYAVGKEADDAESIFEKHPFGDALARSISFYRTVSGVCRRAALCAVWCFRRRLGRDVATIIAKLIYASRSSPTNRWLRVVDMTNGWPDVHPKKQKMNGS
jgi:hypothetical protein